MVTGGRIIYETNEESKAIKEIIDFWHYLKIFSTKTISI